MHVVIGNSAYVVLYVRLSKGKSRYQEVSLTSAAMQDCVRTRHDDGHSLVYYSTCCGNPDRLAPALAGSTCIRSHVTRSTFNPVHRPGLNLRLRYMHGIQLYSETDMQCYTDSFDSTMLVRRITSESRLKPLTYLAKTMGRR